MSSGKVSLSSGGDYSAWRARNTATKENTVLVGVLADFVNLEVSGLANFRQKNPNFAPGPWWDFLVPPTAVAGPNLWKFSQWWLRRAWDMGFNDNLFDTLACLLSVYEKLPDYPGRNPVFGSLGELGLTPCGYQKAVIYLMSHPNQAKHCGVCNKRFFGPHGAEKHCSDECVWIKRKEDRRKDWKKHKAERNKSRRRKKRAC
jgi:predicted nucleic acid-binding Zn ribbon protein